MTTEIGEYLGGIRQRNGELLMDMAKKLGMSPAMLSSVEHGKRNPPKGLVENVVTAYGLDAEQRVSLELALARTKEEVSVRLDGLTADDQELAFSFARRFAELDPQSKAGIRKILNHGEE